MDKRSCFLNNPSSETIRITELNISLPPGVSNLFELDPNLTYEKIDYSMRMGTLRAAMDNGLCYIVPDTSNQGLSNDVLIRKPFQVQIHPSRARFNVVQNSEPQIFDPQDDAGLFEEQDVKPARELEEQLRKSADNIQPIEATVREANLPEKPIENRYTPPPVKQPEVQQKIKNDLQMGYETCNGLTADGSRCMRRAKTGKRFCGLHKNQA